MNSYLAQNRPLDFKNKLINASGMLAFSPDKKKRHIWGILDAFVTNAISFRPRKVAANPALINFPGGSLQHNGLPNPGIKQCLKKYQSQWAKASLPIIPTIIENDPSQLSRMVRQLEKIDNLLAINILFAEDFSRQLVLDLLRAAQGEIPIIASLAMEASLEFSEELIQSGASAIALSPSRGTVKDDQGEVIQGRLYGPNQFPRALYIVQQLAQLNIPVIGGNGVYTIQDAQLMLDLGAIAVQLDSVLWKADWDEKGWQFNSAPAKS